QVLYLAGDAEQLRQTELISELNAAGIDTVSLLKVPHHGVYNKGIDAFFSACRPQYAIITCSDKNPPDPETLSCLHALDAKTFLTADGDIRVVCTEDSITVTQ
ncbi:MAG: MBL fold metallo-hydrolase, partial [Clostridia bacterium]|nr:MBL fold metallo-hydrolase [Clostridia bacterium]